MAKITWTAEAQRWLEDIFEYITADNPDAAAETINGIYEQTQLLATFPEMGHRYWASSLHARILLYGHYRIAYLIKGDGNVDILGVSMVRWTSASINSKWRVPMRRTARAVQESYCASHPRVPEIADVSRGLKGDLHWTKE